MNFHDDDKGQQQTSDLLLLPFQILVSSRFLGTRIIVEQVPLQNHNQTKLFLVDAYIEYYFDRRPDILESNVVVRINHLFVDNNFFPLPYLCTVCSYVKL